jgi:pimeloyl-ACP methyl ester carboxylesterase
MTSIYFPKPELLQNLPLSRAAFSNRTAWIMAAISWLAYQRLPGESELGIEEVVQEIAKAAKENRRSQIRELVLRYRESGQQTNCQLLTELEQAGFSFIQGFDSRVGTQAFLARLNGVGDQPPMLILAFRGTETKSIADIKSDAKLVLMNAPGGGRVHPGFYEAFASVQAQVQNALNQNGECPLYIAGHSLGGGLALVATRYLVHPKSAATYTFGGPRVGDEAFFADFRIPVYRVVNGADVVARLPFGEWLSLLLALIRLIPINGTTTLASWLRNTIVGYTHTGSSVYLSDSINTLPDDNGIPYSDLQVKQDPEFLWRTQLTITRFRRGGFKAFVADHDISTYAKKLYANAQRRNLS